MTITTRSGKGSALTHTELDTNFTDLRDSVGYLTTGQGGTVTQASSKSTGVTLSKKCGAITMNGAALAAGAVVSFTLTNTTIAATDVLVLNHSATGTAGAYLLNAQAAAGSAAINVTNITSGSLSEAIVISFAVVKATTS
jgi:hypothetical protein